MCWKCKNPIDISNPIYRTSVCSVCATDLHSCLNCRHYLKGAHYDCHETIDELVKDKERSNFCDHFSPKAVFDLCESDKKNTDTAAKAFNALFGD